jgi:hypothetical protein
MCRKKTPATAMSVIEIVSESVSESEIESAVNAEQRITAPWRSRREAIVRGVTGIRPREKHESERPESERTESKPVVIAIIVNVDPATVTLPEGSERRHPSSTYVIANLESEILVTASRLARTMGVVVRTAARSRRSASFHRLVRRRRK